MNCRGDAYFEEDCGYIFFGRHAVYECRMSSWYIGHMMDQRCFKKMIKTIRWALASDPELISRAFMAIEGSLKDNGYGNRNAVRNYEYLKQMRVKHGIQ